MAGPRRGFPIEELKNGCQRSNRAPSSTGLWYIYDRLQQPNVSCHVCSFLLLKHADAIDNGQFKKAVQLADKIMKKQNDLVCAKVS